MTVKEEIQKQLNDLTTIFESIEGCELIHLKEDRILIASKRPVRWAQELKPQYGESEYKIGYIMPKKTCLGIYIDFPKGEILKDEISTVVSPDEQIQYVSQTEKSPGRTSWWRYRTAENFNSLHMVIHADCLVEYEMQRAEVQRLFQQIVQRSSI